MGCAETSAETTTPRWGVRSRTRAATPWESCCRRGSPRGSRRAPCPPAKVQRAIAASRARTPSGPRDPSSTCTPRQVGLNASSISRLYTVRYTYFLFFFLSFLFFYPAPVPLLLSIFILYLQYKVETILPRISICDPNVSSFFCKISHSCIIYLIDVCLLEVTLQM